MPRPRGKGEKGKIGVNTGISTLRRIQLSLGVTKKAKKPTPKGPKVPNISRNSLFSRRARSESARQRRESKTANAESRAASVDLKIAATAFGKKVANPVAEEAGRAAIVAELEKRQKALDDARKEGGERKLAELTKAEEDAIYERAYKRAFDVAYRPAYYSRKHREFGRPSPAWTRRFEDWIRANNTQRFTAPGASKKSAKKLLQERAEVWRMKDPRRTGVIPFTDYLPIPIAIEEESNESNERASASSGTRKRKEREARIVAADRARREARNLPFRIEKERRVRAAGKIQGLARGYQTRRKIAKQREEEARRRREAEEYEARHTDPTKSLIKSNIPLAIQEAVERDESPERILGRIDRAQGVSNVLKMKRKQWVLRQYTPGRMQRIESRQARTKATLEEMEARARGKTSKKRRTWAEFFGL